MECSKRLCLFLRFSSRFSRGNHLLIYQNKKKSDLYFVKHGHSDSNVKAKILEVPNNQQFPKRKIEENNSLYSENHDLQSNSKQFKTKIYSSSILDAFKNKSNSNSSEICETIVHKYSPVPALPRSAFYGLYIDIPEEPDSEAVPSPLQRFFLGRFSKYLVKFQHSLANEMPDTFHILNTFTNGFKEFVLDFRDYIAVVVKMSLPFYDLEDLSRRELELYVNMPRQMIKVFPVVAISSLPFAQNLALPVAYIFPKYLLCYQFWDAKQRQDFPVSYLRKRLFNARPVFRSLQTRIDEVDDLVLRRKCQSIFFSLGSGVHPTLEQILDVKILFSDEPYHLNLLWAQHVNGLLRLHNKSALIRRRHRLREHARYLHCMDKALVKEGIDLLTSEQLRNMLLLRGINPSGMSDIEKRDFLEKWIFISRKINENSYSLLLHLPIFLAYNHPTNLLLIYN